MSLKLAELYAKQDGEPVVATQGVVKRVDKFRSGVSKTTNKPYAFQDILLTEDGVDFPACLVDRDEVGPEVLGKRLTFVCHKGERGFTGVKIRSREAYANGKKTGKVENVLWITQTAQIAGIPSDKSRPSEEEPSPGDERPQTSAPGRAEIRNHQAPNPSVALSQAKAFIGRNRSCVLIALRVAMRIKVDFETHYKYEMPDTVFASCFNSLLFGAGANGIPSGLPVDLDFETLQPSNHKPSSRPPTPTSPPPPPPEPEPVSQVDTDDSVPF